MAIIDFAGREAADAWKDRLNALNERTDLTLKGAGEALQELNNNSEGSVVRDLVDTGVQMIDRTADVIKSFNDIVSIFENAFQKLIERITKTTEDVRNAKSEMVNF